MNKVVQILMERDGISEDDARLLVNETRDEILTCDDPCNADEVIMDYLNLEPDYIFDILGF